MADSTVLKEEIKENKTAQLYSPELVDRANAAAQNLESVAAARPGSYASKYQPQIDAAMDKVLNRPNFNYNVNEDALYQQYKDRYMAGGKQAMQDTMGQAAMLTGGYGSTYGQRVGQQTYDQYMQGLTDKIPQLYQLAMDKYDRDYAYDKDRLSVLDAADTKDYGRWGDSMNFWMNDRNYAAGRYDTQLGQAMAAGDSMFSRLSALIQMGYTPTKDEMRAAGMTPDHVAALQGAFLNQGGGDGGGGGGGSSSYRKQKGQDGDFSLDALSALEDGQYTPSQIEQMLVNAGASTGSAAASVAKAQNVAQQLSEVKSVPKPR